MDRHDVFASFEFHILNRLTCIRYHMLYHHHHILVHILKYKHNERAVKVFLDFEELMEVAVAAVMVEAAGSEEL